MGFIADLPTELVAAFRATLEEVLEADVIAHVRDAAHDESDAQKADVLKVLAELGVPEDRPMIEVLNKIDLLPDEARGGPARRQPAGQARGGGFGAHRRRAGRRFWTGFEAEVTHDNIGLDLNLEASDGASLAWVYRHAQVTEAARAGGNRSPCRFRISPQDLGRFQDRFPGKIELSQQIAA